MQYLIDTHVCLWAITDYEKLSAKVEKILEDKRIQIYVSQVSFLEIAIKLHAHKIDKFNSTFPEFIDSVNLEGFEILPFKNEHSIAYSNFNFFPEHRDPFDRYFIATAQYEQMDFITIDKKYQLYTDKVKIIW